MRIKTALLQGMDRCREALLRGTPSTVQPQSPDYGDWTWTAVWAHLAGWVEFSAQKLTSIRHQKPVNEVEDLEFFNRNLWQRSLDWAPDQARDRLITALDTYIQAVRLFTEDELERTDFPTGFGFSLGKYMVMDAVVHPVQHLLYQELKWGNALRFSQLCLDFFDLFWDFGGRSLDAFGLGEFSDGLTRERISRLKEQKETSPLARVILDALEPA